MASDFAIKLLDWYDRSHRDLPWRNTRDPYLIWLSEIILQQTRVAQGMPYYQRFTSTLPTVKDFAEASEDDILKLWQGLGYYSRARNMHKAAQKIVNQHNSSFPKTYKELLGLPGVGPYTASAIASFAFDLPHPVVDGNVQRFIARFAGISDPINSSAGEKKIREFIDEIFDKNQPAKFNQAVMEFGALQCTPKNPDCQSCPFANSCWANTHHEQEKLPVKIKNNKKKKRFLNYLIPVDPAGFTLLHKRTGKGIWQNLYQFPLFESTDLKRFGNGLEGWEDAIGIAKPPINAIQTEEWITDHMLSHQKLKVRFVIIQLEKDLSVRSDELEKAHINSILTNFAVPRIIEKFVIDVGWS